MTEAGLRAYLLGRASEEAAVRLEERLLGDESAFDALRSAEDDLFDDYVRDRLTPEDRAHFLQRYRGETDRLAFARALARRTAAPARHQKWWALAAAATLMVVVGGMLNTRDTIDVLPQALVVDTPAVVQTPPVVAILALGATRSAAAAPAVNVPAGVARLELRLQLSPADRFERYAVDLRSAGDVVVWRAADLRATPDGRELLLVANVPATVLATGGYEVSVHGLAANMSLEPLGFVTLQINRTP